MNKTIKKSTLALAVTFALQATTTSVYAQSNEPADSDDGTEVITVTGIRSALASALNEKRNASNIKEVIQAEDIGKLPDSNLAEVLENVTGIQITRDAGVGSSVQIRGQSANRVEINGVSTINSAGARGGISFDDLPAALIASVEVTKAPTASQIEGSAGGTINLKTMRGLGLKEQLLQFKAQAEHSDLADSTTPKISGTFGDNWDTAIGRFGVVITGNYSEQDVASANPRFDRDRMVSSTSNLDSREDFDYLRTQFLDQPLVRYDYETKNITTSVEFAPTDDLKFFFDATINQQEKATKTARAYFSGTGAGYVVNEMDNRSFEQVDLGSVDSRYGTTDLGSVWVVTEGIIPAASQNADGTGGLDPNLRIDGKTGARQTDSEVYSFGGKWTTNKFVVSAEISHSSSESELPSLNSTLDFINPNSIQPSANTSADNGTPAHFKISDDTFEFGIAQGLATTPSKQDLLAPENYALNQISQGFNVREGSETAFRADITYDISDINDFFTDVKVGIRSNTTETSVSDSTNQTKFAKWNRPRADLFSDIVSKGPDNFGDVDGRTMWVADYLMIDADTAFDNPGYIVSTIDNAIIANDALNGAPNGDPTSLSAPTIVDGSAFEIEEKTVALYAQVDFDFELGDMPISGNLGVRYVDTEQSSFGQSIFEQNGEKIVEDRNSTNSYDFVLPRLNIVAELDDDLLLKLGAGKDIRRPEFGNLKTSVKFSASPYAAVTIGNPDLVPEDITALDLSLEYYISDAAFASVGFFHKEFNDTILRVQEDAPLLVEVPDGFGMERDVDGPVCEDGGIWNPAVPAANYNVESSRTDTQGICTAKQEFVNSNVSRSYSGIELAAQYDLSEFENELGWASGFGIIANYTYIDESGGETEYYQGSNAINDILNRTDATKLEVVQDDGTTIDTFPNATPGVDDDVVSQTITLNKISKHAYNVTAFYDKNDFNVRVRYTWRDAYVQSESKMRFNIPPIVGSRGQLNASIGYDVNENLNVGVQAVNLLREDSTKWCFNEGALLCEQSLTDRKITLGVTGKF